MSGIPPGLSPCISPLLPCLDCASASDHCGRGVFALGEAKQKPDIWWIGSLVLLAVSIIGFVYAFWTNSELRR